MADHFRGRIGRRVVFGFVGLVVAVVGACGWIFFQFVHARLEQQMNEHLRVVTQLVADRIDGDVVVGIRPEYSLYRRLRHQLIQVRDEVGAQRIYVFGPKALCLLDTGAESVVGKPYPRLAFDRIEVESVWKGQAVCSVRFQNEEGVNFQTGYAPIFSGERVVGAVGVEIGVGFVEDLRKRTRDGG